MNKDKIINILFFCLIVQLITCTPSQNKRKLVQIKAFPDPDSQIEGDYLAHPFDLALVNDRYYVTDTIENCIKVFNRNGDYICQIGSKGSGPGEFIDPFNIAADNQNIYCENRGNHRISIFTVDGVYSNGVRTMQAIRAMETCNGFLFTLSYNIKTGSIGNIYTTRGKLIRVFGSPPRVDKIKDNFWKELLYNHLSLRCRKDTLFIAYEALPIIQAYNSHGELLHVIELKDKKILGELKKNTVKKKVFIDDQRMRIRVWSRGFDYDGEFFYCYDPFIYKAMLVINRNGETIDRLYLDMDPENSMYMFFKQKNGDQFIFVDLTSDSQVKIFAEQKRD